MDYLKIKNFDDLKELISRYNYIVISTLIYGNIVTGASFKIADYLISFDNATPDAGALYLEEKNQTDQRKNLIWFDLDFKKIEVYDTFNSLNIDINII